MASPGKDNYRMKSYKNKALNPQEMRRRREEEGIQLRKQKREEQLCPCGFLLTLCVCLTLILLSFCFLTGLCFSLSIVSIELPVVSGKTVVVVVLLYAVSVPIFIELLNSEYEDVQEQAVWALGNIAGDNAECRDYVLNCGILPSLQQTHHRIFQISCPDHPAPILNRPLVCVICQVSPCLNVLSRLLFSSDPDVLADACWALSYLSDGPNEKIQTVIDSGVCRRLVELLISLAPLLSSQVILNCSALPCLLHLLSSPKESIKKEACWTVSNITAGNRAQIQNVIDANIFPVLIEILQKAEFRTRKEAAWAITNATSGGTPSQIKYLVSLNAIKPMCDLLTVMDSKIVQVSLNGLENILRLGEQEAKQNGTGINPYCALIEEAYGNEEDASLAPQVDQNQGQFVFQQQEGPMEGFQL
uniref:Karyopherin alpha 5 (importin alpha 6) n=1 Tax=Neolamprologus brichardi TaxID=32507 RepID=A0A3Q4HXB6_NEOBR